MSIIYSFLQKRKMHENQHGFRMVFAAYALSAFLLALGSDIFYDINPSAAEISKDSKEETPKMAAADIAGVLRPNDTKSIFNTSLVNPYGLSDYMSEAPSDLKTSAVSTADMTYSKLKTAEIKETEIMNYEKTSKYSSTSGDTIWLFGQAMKGEDFDALMVKLSSEKSSAESKEASKEKKSEEVKSLSVKDASGSDVISVSKDEVKMLERIVEAEATGEDMIGKILVVNVIFNRIADEAFPDTVEDVIFQKSHGDYQFSPVSDKRYWSVKITKETKEAVQRALQGEDYSDGALYFIARKRSNKSSAKWFDQHLDWLFKHGGHEFYKNK